MEKLSIELDKVSSLLASREYEKAVSALPTDIRYLRPLLEQIAMLNRHGTVCWLVTLLANPFALTLCPEETRRAAAFLLDMSRECCIAKLSLRGLALLVLKTNAPHSEERLSVCGIEISRTTYYSFLLRLSRITRIKAQHIEKNDSAAVNRMKIKIMAANPDSSTLKIYMDLLNERDTRLGWTLSKAFFKVAKHVDAERAVDDLKRRCSSIFANEETWINVCTILGIMVLNGWGVGDIFQIVSEAINYTNEAVQASERVREAALFLLWASVRSCGGLDENMLHLVAARAFFDSSLICRRGAAAVVLEYIGRAERVSGYRLVSLINFHSVKRIEMCSEAVGEAIEIMDCRDAFEDAAIRNLFHSRLESRRQSASCIARYFSAKAASHVVLKDLNTPSDFISALLLTREFIRQGRLAEIAGVVELVGRLRVDAAFSRCRDFNVFVQHYVEIAAHLREHGDEGIVCENLHLFLTKNIHPEEVSRACWMFVGALGDRLVAGLKRRSEAFILANACNAEHRAEVEKVYTDILENGDIDGKTHVMRAVGYMEQPCRFRKYIDEGLENYSIDYRGDSSAALRRESLLASFLCDSPGTSRHFVRLFAGKSKMLRDECIAMCRSSGVFESGFEYIPRRSCPVDVQKLAPARAFLNEFYRSFRAMEQECEVGNDNMFFAAAVDASGLLDQDHLTELVTGLLGSIGHSDASLHTFILETLFQKREQIYPAILRLLEAPSRVTLPLLTTIQRWTEMEEGSRYASAEIRERVLGLAESCEAERDIEAAKSVLCMWSK